MFIGDEGVSSSGSMSPPNELSSTDEDSSAPSEPSSPADDNKKEEPSNEKKEMVRQLEDGEVYLVHDIGFVVQISLPNGEKFDLQVNMEKIIIKLNGSGPLSM